MISQLLTMATQCGEIGNYATSVAITEGLENILLCHLPVCNDHFVSPLNVYVDKLHWLKECQSHMQQVYCSVHMAQMVQ